MTNARRRKRKRVRAEYISLPGGDVAKNPRQGLPRLHNQKHDNSPPPIYDARVRLGISTPKDNLNESDMGRCILFLTSGDDLALCRNTWGAISAARANYKARIMGHTGTPQGSAAAVVHEEIQTDPNMRVDLRSGEERDRDADANWQNWKAHIAALPTPWQKRAIMGALDGFFGEGLLWTQAKPTKQGGLAVQALKLIGKMRQ